VNTYEWGDFRGNPRVLMERYYDAFCYLANWGTRWLSFRVPARLLDLPTAQRYCVGDAASARAGGEHLVIDLISEDEEGDELDWGGEGGCRRSSRCARSWSSATYGCSTWPGCSACRTTRSRTRRWSRPCRRGSGS
jgi:hypothetical protein